MPYIQQNQNPSGAYPAPQKHKAPGLIPLTDEQAAMVTQYNGFVTITSREEEYEEGFFRTVYDVTPNTEAWEAWKGTQPSEEDALAEKARSKRDLLLSETDWTQTLDAPITRECSESFRVYRQELRDITEQEGFPSSIKWPEKPEVVKGSSDPVDTAFIALVGGEQK